MSTITVDVPSSLAKRILDLARNEGLTASQFLASAAAEKVAVWEADDIIKKRAAAVDSNAISTLLSKVPDIEAEHDWDNK
ncbi:MAG: toxin-antitoxin system HicB family antitoxin [bacterium]